MISLCVGLRSVCEVVCLSVISLRKLPITLECKYDGSIYIYHHWVDIAAAGG